MIVHQTGAASLFRRIGRLEEPRVEPSMAGAMPREMGMAFWVPEVETELAQADGSVVG